MNSRRFIASLLLIFLCTPLLAQDNRLRWNYRTEGGRGYFTAVGGDAWVEFLANGGKCTFKETYRTNEYIEIYDSTRGEVWVRLYRNVSHWKHPQHTKGEWQELWKGAWEHELKGQDSHVHVLLVIDTSADPERTHGLAIAGDRMAALLETLPAAEKSRVHVTQLRGDDASPTRIRRYFAQLQSNPTDVLFFYYMGHGGVDGNRENGQWRNGSKVGVDFGAYDSRTGIFSAFPESSDPTYHRLAMKHGWMNRLEIYDLMLACPSRACIIFADCCGNFVRGRDGDLVGPDYRTDSAAQFAARLRKCDSSDVSLTLPGKINPELWRKLFCEHMGLIDLAGAPVGYFGLADPRFGGMSSFALTELLCAPTRTIGGLTSENTNWPDTNKIPDWTMFQQCVLTAQYCKEFPQRKSERTARGQEERIYSFGPRLFDPMGQVYPTAECRQIDDGSAVFGLMPDSGVVCRIQPGTPVPAGFYYVSSCEGISPNYSNAKQIYDKIVSRRVRSIQIAQNPAVPTQRDPTVYSLTISPSR